jgi:hypothetical protein
MLHDSSNTLKAHPLPPSPLPVHPPMAPTDPPRPSLFASIMFTRRIRTAPFRAVLYSDNIAIRSTIAVEQGITGP